MAQLVDEGAEELRGVLDVDFRLGGPWLGGVADGIDEGYEEDDGLEELVDDARAQGNWFLSGVVYGPRGIYGVDSRHGHSGDVELLSLKGYCELLLVFDSF